MEPTPLPGPSCHLLRHRRRARGPLDAYAKVDGPLDVEGLVARLSAVELDHRPSRDDLLPLVEHLESDHYLQRRGHADGFSSRILRDAWRRMRRL